MRKNDFLKVLHIFICREIREKIQITNSKILEKRNKNYQKIL